MRQFLLALALLLAVPHMASAQYYTPEGDDEEEMERHRDPDEPLTAEDILHPKKQKKGWGRDTTSVEKETPIGIFQWTIDERLGDTIHAENNDTVVHQFNNYNLVDGYNGEYSHTGNVGSPRLSRIFLNRQETSDFIFLDPLSFFLDPIREFRFSNTLSPLTNLAYHKVGSSQAGQDRVRAYFASNINKVSGIGFKLDYLYGRGYYNNQANSQFGGTVFGYYLGDRYNLHAYVNANHSKMAENGGIESDAYITNPQSFPQNYTSRDIPTVLDQTWNRNDNQTYYLTHRINAGHYVEREVPDSLKPKMPADDELLAALRDSVRQLLQTDSLRRTAVVDSLRTQWTAQLVTPRDFVPVMSFIHTLRIDHLQHTHYAYNVPSGYYTNHYYGDPTNVRDIDEATSVRNTLGLQLREGFNRWAKMGISLFATHELQNFLLPADSARTVKYRENNISVGGAITKTQGSLLHYNVTGEVWLVGRKAGQFKVEGDGDLNFRLRRDTIQLRLHAYIKNLKPSFFYTHFHSQSTWWDRTGLDNELRERIEGWFTLRRTRTSLRVGFENINKYLYLGMKNTLTAASPSTAIQDYSHDVAPRQASGGLQVLSATLGQDFKFGPLHWDSELTYQQTTDDQLLPLPKFNAYTNLYLVFRIAKVLRVQLGGDLRYFTNYYAPDYFASIQQFALQDSSQPRVKCGNYPIINAYVNLHIKHCRIYFAVNHVNAGHGRYFLTPHHPIDPLNIHFGLSWNFFD